MNQHDNRSCRGLSGNTLKLIAAVSMLLDHAGVILFPGCRLLRILGRLAFPIFAFMIAEGCRYTRNRVRYFLRMFVLACLCQTVYFLVDGSMYLGILFTFSLAVPVIWSVQQARELLAGDAPLLRKTLGVLSPLALTACLYLLNRYVVVDYGFWGCMCPVLAGLLPDGRYQRTGSAALLGLGLLALGYDHGGIQYYALLALPLLLCYSGARGRLRMKYFFYIFYPAHMVLLYGIALLVR